MTLLTIDFGNTLTKVDVWDDSGHLYHQQYAETDGLARKIVKDFFNSRSIDAVISSSVRSDRERVLEEIRTISGVETIDFGKQIEEYYRSRIKYEGMPGADRIAAYLGAAAIFPGQPLLIADAGTALTLDVVNDRGEFCGGTISPGIFTRMKALNLNTSLLPLVDNLDKVPAFGYNTATAIASGSLMGAVSEVLFALERAQREYGVEKIVMTGGDASYMLPLLEKETGNIVYEPLLVAKGLLEHYKGINLG